MFLCGGKLTIFLAFSRMQDLVNNFSGFFKSMEGHNIPPHPFCVNLSNYEIDFLLRRMKTINSQKEFSFCYSEILSELKQGSS